MEETDMERLKSSFDSIGISYDHKPVISDGYQSLAVRYGDGYIVDFNFDKHGSYDSVD